MTSNAETNRKLAARLLRALERSDELSHEQAQTLLPSLIGAQLAGEDVEAEPAYASLLRHLDQCDVCSLAYEDLAEELEALISDDASLLLMQPTSSEMLDQTLQTETALVRIFKGIKSRFEIDLKIPQFSAALQTLGSVEQLFAGQLPGVPGTPFVAVAITIEQGKAELAIAIRQLDGAARWQIQLMRGDDMQTMLTDEAGIARFADLDVENLTDVRLDCTEATEQPG
jgi:hypothetical protein